MTYSLKKVNSLNICGWGEGVASQVLLKSVHELGLKFCFHYHSSLTFPKNLWRRTQKLSVLA